MPLSSLDACITLLCTVLTALLYKRRSSSAGQKGPSHDQDVFQRPQGYLLHNQVTHARLLPKDSAHAFTYPTLAFLISLDALERRRLDLAGGWVFGYGRLWGRITGLRSDPYLTQEFGSIRGKLEGLLIRSGFEAGRFQDAWMFTMPSFMGYEGINPLTVYFCYDSEGAFWLTVLEIHNTFGESHVHILELGRDEDESPSLGYDHQWTFPRRFHVSPFNDRSGFYTISIKSPSHSPMASTNIPDAPPRPSVRVHQYTTSESDPTKPGVLKLTALLRPTHSTRLTTLSLLLALVKAPFALLLTLPRILYVAWILHYVKRLDVYLRPDPLPSTDEWDTSDSRKPQNVPVSLGLKWLDEGALERFARLRIQTFLRRRTEELGVRVTLVSANPQDPNPSFAPSTTKPEKELIIWYTSSKFFTVLFLCPSAAHSLLLGCDTEKIFRVSSRDVFLNVFSTSSVSNQSSILQHLRSRHLPKSLNFPVPAVHFLDEPRSWRTTLSSAAVISANQLLDWVEKSIFGLVKARVVEGQEPWTMWDRAEARWKSDFGASMAGSGM
ncbi:hypothetical protein BDN70DRAFT_833053 [Pholiota conissans]|uniref:DUF1365-domain-containing protein n=1 Tax=Pholiota conissans TaxID=109636 RepID=A0A9P5Z433_9AGAR|nr:hypothetical protein BDN70DRAFT_833053 [Pholiota conissans]